MPQYIYQYSNWPQFTWDREVIEPLLGKLRLLQGKVLGKMESVGFSIQEQTNLSALTAEVLKTSEIEGKHLNLDQVRSSIARKLGIEVAGMVNSTRDVDGVVEMMMDATQNFQSDLTHERLYGWHAALFPIGWSGMYKIQTGEYRDGEMQIVSGPLHRQKVHYTAPNPQVVMSEMTSFLQWLNQEQSMDDVIKAAVAHFWFIIIHPFDDGNGRIARAITELLLAKSESSSQRFYSLSSQVLAEKKQYYSVLQDVQHSDGDITEWLVWFLNCFYKALESTNDVSDKIIQKANFWEKHKETELNARQRLMLNKLLDGFDGKLKTSKWAKITKSSSDTALRDIKDLIKKGILKQEESGGRSTNYELIL